MAEVSLMVTFHKTQKRVLWAETDKVFVDFLFCLFSIPMGQVFNILKDVHEYKGCLTKLYQSVHEMGKGFMVCDKDDILNPKVHLSSVPSLLKIENNSIVAPSPPYTTLVLYTCNSTCRRTFSTYAQTCQSCRSYLNDTVTHYVSNPNPTNSLNGEGNGLVKGGVVKYIVTDDLSVTPKSNFSSLAYLKRMHIVDLNQVEEKAVNVNVEKCKELMKLVLTSNHMALLTKLFKDEVGF